MNATPDPEQPVRPATRRFHLRRHPHPAALFVLAGVVAVAALPTALLKAAQTTKIRIPAIATSAAAAPVHAAVVHGALVSATEAMARTSASADGSDAARRLAKDAALRRSLAKLQSARAGALASSVVVGGSVADIPAVAVAAYQRAAVQADQTTPGCDISWTLVAGIGRVESDHGSNGGSTLAADGEVHPAILGPVLDGTGGNAAIPDTDGGRLDGNTRWDRAVGPMQFIPSTWATWGRDGNGDGTIDPENMFDAALAAADYLCASGGDLNTPAGAEQAVLSYNHSLDYVLLVLGYSSAYGGQDLSPVSTQLAQYLAALAGAQAKATPKPAKPAPKKQPKPSPKPSPTPVATPKPTARPTPKPSGKPKPTKSVKPTWSKRPTPTPTRTPTKAPSPSPSTSAARTSAPASASSTP